MTCMLRNNEEDIQKIFDIEVDCALPSFWALDCTSCPWKFD